MVPTVEQAFEMAKAGAQALMRAWGQTVRAELVAEVDRIVNAGGIVRVVVDGGLHGAPFTVSGYLVSADKTDVKLLFSLTPEGKLN